MKKTHYRIL